MRIKESVKKLGTVMMIAGAAALPAYVAAEKVDMSKMANRFQPELRQKLSEISPEIKDTLAGLMGKHSQRSEVATMRQVMIEILMDYQALAAAIATDNREAAVAAANRIADHRLPVGGMLAYLPMDKINDETLAALPTLGGMVEGGVMKVAEFAAQGDMGRAATALGEVTAGCVACHATFRGVPGVSSRLKPAQ